jgi:hypothetical protein
MEAGKPRIGPTANFGSGRSEVAVDNTCNDESVANFCCKRCSQL